jgi:transposase InsO family protein
MNLLDARRKLEAWRRDYNQNRPHISVGDLTRSSLPTRRRPVFPAWMPQMVASATALAP